MSLGDLWDIAKDAVQTAASSNPAIAAAQTVARLPEAAAWVSIPSTIAIESVEQVANDSWLWDLSPAQVVPSVGDAVTDVGQWGFEHRGWIGSASGWVDNIAGLLTNKWFWLAVLVVVALLALTPMVRAGYRVTERPRDAYRSVRKTWDRGLKGNAKQLGRWWVNPRTQHARQRRLSIPNGKMAQQYRHGSFAVVEYRNPAPPLMPRAVGIKATDPQSAKRCLSRNFPGQKWRPERSDQYSQDLTLFHYVRARS